MVYIELKIKVLNHFRLIDYKATYEKQTCCVLEKYHSGKYFDLKYT